MAQTPPDPHLARPGLPSQTSIGRHANPGAERGVSPDSRYQTEICPTALPQDAAGLHSEQGTAGPASLTLLELQTGNNHQHHQWGTITDGFQLPRPTEVDQLNNFAGLTPAVKHCTELIS